MERIKQLLIDLYCDSDEDDEVELDDRPARRGGKQLGAAALAAAGVGSSSSSRSSKAQARSGSKRQEKVETELAFIKKVYNGFPVFSDQQPDPGCGFEVLSYRQQLDPVFVPKELKESLQVCTCLHRALLLLCYCC
jgi:hypothetical protein